MTGINKNIRVIGMVLEDIFADFSAELISNVIQAIPDDSNIRLVVLPGRYYHPDLPHDDVRDYNEVYNNIFQLGKQCNFDGFIVHIGNLSSKRSNSLADSLVGDFKKVPSVFIATNIENVTTVGYDNERGIREAVDYLVNINGLTRLCMLGGREDNMDSILRKDIFIRCLEENGISFSEENYINTDMSVNCIPEATELLDRNPRVQAVFCVNDAAAKALYDAMEARNLVPGKDILVFGFDNTHMATELIPTLTSIGCDRWTLGQKALELLMKKLDGENVSSALVPTRLYGRESFCYEMYDYTTLELSKCDPSFIYRMFDDCFYRYKNAAYNRENVNLKRLFFEFISRMLLALQNRSITHETYLEICKLIDIFYENDILQYTDAAKLLQSIEKLQSAINLSHGSPAVTGILNRLFARMKDRTIASLAERNIREISTMVESRGMLQDFLITGMVNAKSGDHSNDKLLCSISKLGMDNTAIYVFDKPVRVVKGQETVFPEEVCLYCISKSGSIYVLTQERQRCRLADIFNRNELSLQSKGYASFPLLYSDRIYGIMICALTQDVFQRGEFTALQIGRNFYINDLQQEIESLRGKQTG